MDASWNFINKIWNASRFVIMNVEGMTAADIDFSGEKTVADRWILTRLNETVARVTNYLIALNSVKQVANYTTSSGMISVIGILK